MEKQTNERRRRETIDQAIAKQKQQQQRKSATYLRLNCFQIFFQKNTVFSSILPHAKAVIATC